MITTRYADWACSFGFEYFDYGRKTEILKAQNISQYITHSSYKVQKGVFWKMRRRMRSNKKGMSIVISTIILVAITITMAIASSFWIMGITNSFMKFERLEFISIYAEVATYRATPGYQAGNYFPVYIQLKNTGQATATINNVFINGKPWDAYRNPTSGQLQIIQSVTPNSLAIGNRISPYVRLLQGTTFSSGDFVEIEIETAAGRLYSNTVVLP